MSFFWIRGTYNDIIWSVLSVLLQDQTIIWRRGRYLYPVNRCLVQDKHSHPPSVAGAGTRYTMAYMAVSKNNECVDMIELSQGGVDNDFGAQTRPESQ